MKIPRRKKAKQPKVSALPQQKRDTSRSLLAAFAEPDLGRVRELLKTPDVDVNETDPNDEDGYTPLMQASQFLMPDIAHSLIARGADVQARDAGGRTALHQLAQHEEVTDKEALAGYIPRIVEMADVLLAAGLDVDVTTGLGMTPLMYAALRSATTVCQFLLDKGANLEKRGFDGYTPLMFAATAAGNGYPLLQNTATISLFLERGASMKAADSLGRNALALAVDAGADEHFKVLTEHGAPLPFLVPQEEMRLMPSVAAARGDLAGLQNALPAGGRNVNAATASGRTPLIWAAAQGFTEGVQFMLAQGAEADARDLRHWTALVAASCYGHRKTVQALFKVRPKLRSAAFALKWAVDNKDHQMITLFLEADALVRADDDALRMGWGGPSKRDAAELGRADLLRALHRDGEPLLLWYPVAAGDEELTRKVLAEVTAPGWVKSHGAAAQTQMLEQALYSAALHGRVEMITLLLEHGAPVNLTNSQDSPSPLIAAARRGHVEAVKALVEAGADPEYRDHRGWTAEDWAEKEGHIAVSLFFAYQRRR